MHTHAWLCQSLYAQKGALCKTGGGNCTEPCCTQALSWYAPARSVPQVLDTTTWLGVIPERFKVRYATRAAGTVPCTLNVGALLVGAK